MSGEGLPRRGEIWWIRLDKRRPAVVVQTDRILDPRVRSYLVVPLTSRLHLEELPGNLRLTRKSTGLKKASVANVYDIQKAFRIDFDECLGQLQGESLTKLNIGLRLALDL